MNPISWVIAALILAGVGGVILLLRMIYLATGQQGVAIVGTGMMIALTLSGYSCSHAGSRDG